MKKEWLDAGIDLLREEGEAALTIDRLCKKLGKTKGSFYHHFADADAFADALLAEWRASLTTRIIVAVEQKQNRQRALAEEARRIDQRLELAIRAWGLRDKRARKAIEEVDQRRIEYMEELWSERTTRARAKVLARVEYAAFVGALQIYPDVSSKEARQVERALGEALKAIR
jgi:AcrR family transcriptional regulator